MRKRIETSKLILIVAAVFFSVITGFTFYAVWLTRDVSPLIALIERASYPITAGVGFYYWKARAENLLKIKIEAKKEGVKYEESDDEVIES